MAESGGTEPFNTLDILVGNVGEGTIQVQLTYTNIHLPDICTEFYKKIKGTNIQLHNICTEFYKKPKGTNIW